MKNFSFYMKDKKFDIVFPVGFDDSVEQVADAIDYGEQFPEEGSIPFSRRAYLLNKILSVISDDQEAELYVEDALKEKLSHKISEAIGRKCRISGTFVSGVRPLNGQFEAFFNVSAISLA